MTAVMTHCKNGHEMTPENSRTRSDEGRPRVVCVTCERERSRRFYASEVGRQRSREMSQRRSRTVRNAYLTIGNRIRRGKLERQPCQECAAFPTEAHHPNGYEGAAALDVEWLCRTHHTARHLAARLSATVGNRPDVATPRVAKATRGAKGAR